MMRPHYTWAGTTLLISAALIRTALAGDWSVVILVVAGALLIIGGIAGDRKARS